MSKQTAHDLTRHISPLTERRINENHCISIELRILTCLRFYATCSYQRIAGDVGGISAASACRKERRVSEAIASLRPQYFNMPDSVKANRFKLLKS